MRSANPKKAIYTTSPTLYPDSALAPSDVIPPDNAFDAVIHQSIIETFEIKLANIFIPCSMFIFPQGHPRVRCCINAEPFISPFLETKKYSFHLPHRSDLVPSRALGSLLTRINMSDHDQDIPVCVACGSQYDFVDGEPPERCKICDVCVAPPHSSPSQSINFPLPFIWVFFIDVKSLMLGSAPVCFA